MSPSSTTAPFAQLYHCSHIVPATRETGIGILLDLGSAKPSDSVHIGKHHLNNKMPITGFGDTEPDGKGYPICHSKN